jgi:L-arabinonolactonase
MIDTRPPDAIVRVQATLGESIVWDAGRQRLWWTDIQTSRLFHYDWARGSLHTVDTPERVGSFGLVAGDGRLITAFASGIGLYDVLDRTIAWLDGPDSITPGLRFNDGKVDRQGRFWAGTMVEAEDAPASACLYSVESRTGMRCHLANLSISNSLCFSPDGRLMYFADSPTQQIGVYELIEPGCLGRRHVFADTPDGAYPDGATVDADGCVWSAHWGAGCVVRYTPAGRVDRILRVPTSQPTCLCFAGPALDVLCVTTAREGLDGPALQRQPHAGDVLLYRLGVKGLAEAEFRV